MQMMQSAENLKYHQQLPGKWILVGQFGIASDNEIVILHMIRFRVNIQLTKMQTLLTS